MRPLSARWARTAIALLVLATLAGCSSAPAPAPPRPAPDRSLDRERLADTRPFLLDPMAGYPLGLDDARRARISAAYQAMVSEGRREEAGRDAARLLEIDPALAAAEVLLAQSELAAGDAQTAAERLRPILQRLPGYTSALLALGRAEETLQRVVEAYGAYRRVLAAVTPQEPGDPRFEPERWEPVATRVAVLHDRVVEILGQRLADALARGRVEQAETELEWLRSWAPDAEVTLEGRRAVAGELGDPEAELAALIELTVLRPEDVDLMKRRADLELEVGSAAQGRVLFQRLADRYPDDPEIVDGLARAQFRWRLEMLPEGVRSLAAVRPELGRAQFAALLYWLMPEVRYGRPERARIASDILDHPWREQIARVVNLDLMAVDPTRHSFQPEREIRRAEVLRALLMTLSTGEPIAACVADRHLDQRSDAGLVCESAARCHLLQDAADCLPQAPLTGAEAVEWIRRALEQR